MVFTQGLALFKLAQILHKELLLNFDHFLHAYFELPVLCVDATLSAQKAGGRRRSHSKGLERSDSFGAQGATEQDEENGLHYITSGSPIKCCIFSISRESHESSLGFRIRKEQILKTPY